MGQRLNIEIVKGETALANCYYHWSAYTSTALALTQTIIDAYHDYEANIGVKMAVELLEKTGAGVNEEERNDINKEPERFGRITFKDAVDRNEGLISVTERGMEGTRRWEEGRVTIDLKNEIFCFDVLYSYSGEEYMEEFDEEYNDPIEALAVCGYDLSAVPFSDIDGLIQLVADNPGGVVGADEVVYQWIA